MIYGFGKLSIDEQSIFEPPLTTPKERHL